MALESKCFDIYSFLVKGIQCTGTITNSFQMFDKILVISSCKGSEYMWNGEISKEQDDSE